MTGRLVGLRRICRLAMAILLCLGLVAALAWFVVAAIASVWAP